MAFREPADPLFGILSGHDGGNVAGHRTDAGLLGATISNAKPANAVAPRPFPLAAPPSLTIPAPNPPLSALILQGLRQKIADLPPLDAPRGPVPVPAEGPLEAVLRLLAAGCVPRSPPASAVVPLAPPTTLATLPVLPPLPGVPLPAFSGAHLPLGLAGAALGLQDMRLPVLPDVFDHHNPIPMANPTRAKGSPAIAAPLCAAPSAPAELASEPLSLLLEAGKALSEHDAGGSAPAGHATATRRSSPPGVSSGGASSLPALNTRARGKRSMVVDEATDQGAKRARGALASRLGQPAAPSQPGPAVAPARPSRASGSRGEDRRAPAVRFQDHQGAAADRPAPRSGRSQSAAGTGASAEGPAAAPVSAHRKAPANPAGGTAGSTRPNSAHDPGLGPRLPSAPTPGDDQVALMIASASGAAAAAAACVLAVLRGQGLDASIMGADRGRVLRDMARQNPSGVPLHSPTPARSRRGALSHPSGAPDTRGDPGRWLEGSDGERGATGQADTDAGRGTVGSGGSLVSNNAAQGGSSTAGAVAALRPPLRPASAPRPAALPAPSRGPQLSVPHTEALVQAPALLQLMLSQGIPKAIPVNGTAPGASRPAADAVPAALSQAEIAAVAAATAHAVVAMAGTFTMAVRSLALAPGAATPGAAEGSDPEAPAPCMASSGGGKAEPATRRGRRSSGADESGKGHSSDKQSYEMDSRGLSTVAPMEFAPLPDRALPRAAVPGATAASRDARPLSRPKQGEERQWQEAQGSHLGSRGEAQSNHLGSGGEGQGS